MQNWRELMPKPTVLPANGGGGDGLTYQRIWEWVTYPDVQPEIEQRSEEGETTYEPAAWWTPKFRGFRALILANPTGGQVRRESEAFRAYGERRMSEPEYLESIADRVKAWDYRIIDDDGNRIDVPAPAADTWERFYDLPAGLLTWVVAEVRTAHIPKAPTRAGRRVGTTDSTNPTPIVPEPELQTS